MAIGLSPSDLSRRAAGYPLSRRTNRAPAELAVFLASSHTAHSLGSRSEKAATPSCPDWLGADSSCVIRRATGADRSRNDQSVGARLLGQVQVSGEKAKAGGTTYMEVTPE